MLKSSFYLLFSHPQALRSVVYQGYVVLFFRIGKDEQSVKGFAVTFAVRYSSHTRLAVGRAAEVKVVDQQIFRCSPAAGIYDLSAGDLFRQGQRRRIGRIVIAWCRDICIFFIGP